MLGSGNRCIHTSPTGTTQAYAAHPCLATGRPIPRRHTASKESVGRGMGGNPQRQTEKKNKTLQPKVLNIQVSSSVIIAQMDTMMRIFVCPSMNPTLFGKSARVLSDHGNLHSTVSVALYPVRNSRQCSLNCEFWG